MRIFITGATGLIGRAVTLRLLGGGHEVAAWVRNEAKARSRLGPEVNLIAAVGGESAMAAEVARTGAIVNLAGEPLLGHRWTEQRRRTLRESRVALTGAIVDAIERSQSRPKVLISASAVGFYGDRGDEPLNDDSPPASGFLADLCRDWEAAALRAQQHGVRVFIPRLGIVLAPDGGALAQMLPPFLFGVGGPLGNGRQFVPWIDLSDLVEIIATALEDEGYSGAAIAAAPFPVINRDFSAALGRTLHRPSLLPVPAWVLHAMFGEAATAMLSSQRVNPGRLRELGFRWSYEKIDESLRHVLAEGDPEIAALSASSPTPENPDGSAYLGARPPRYLLRHTTRVPAPIAAVFSFFSHPQNLGVMTPADMQFQIKGEPPGELARGAAIEYTLRVGPIPLSWRTRIETWQPGRLFIDSQEAGPYRCWWHEHHFRPDGDATIMEDRIYFAPPLGAVGGLAGHALVMPQLRKIFRFRTQAMRLRFPPPAAAHNPPTTGNSTETGKQV